MDNIKVINDYNEVDFLLFDIEYNNYLNLQFKNNNLKNYFLSKLNELNINTNLINCNSSIERFYDDYQQEGLKVFFNIDLCKDFDILKIVKNTPSINIW